MKKLIIIILSLYILFSFAGCSTNRPKDAATETTILIAAASSLKNCMDNELIPLFTEQNPDIKVNATYDSSGKLQKQIEEGAEIDVFISASKKQMDALNNKGLISENSIINLLENKIVLIVPKGIDNEITTFEDTLKASTIAVGDPQSVPAGQYAKELFEALGIWEQISLKSSFGTNVTEVLNWIAEGSADAGVVYATDAVNNDKVTVVAEAPEGKISKVIYPVGIIKATKYTDAAKLFTEFLESDESLKIFKLYGYSYIQEKKMKLSPILISMKTASTAIIITFLLGLLIAQLVVKIKSEKVKMVIDGLLTLPLVLPPTVMGFFILIILGVKRPLGKFLLEFFSVKIVFSWTATAIAAVIISFPLMYRSARGAFEQVDQELIMAGRTLGMSENKIFRKIIMPLASPGIASGGVLAFARGLGEFGATAMIAGNIENVTRTLPLAIYSEVAAGNMSAAKNYVIVVLVTSFVVIVLMNYFTFRGRKYLNKGKVR